MSRMIEIRKQVADLKKKKLELLFSVASNRPASYVNDLRNIKTTIAKLKAELKNLGK